jgi:hypothetical protein
MADINWVFSNRATGRGFVEGFVARVVLSMAKGVQMSKILRDPWDVRAEQAWSLAAILVLWYSERLPSAELNWVRQVFQGVSIGPISMALVSMHDRLNPFVQKAYEARAIADLARAGGYFMSAMEWLGLESVRRMLNTEQVLEVIAKVKARLPMRPEITGPYEEALGYGPKPEATPPASTGKTVQGARGTSVQKSRAEKFDQVDLIRTTPPATEAPPPRLEANERLIAVLYTRGWKQEDIERITKGPKGS